MYLEYRCVRDNWKPICKGVKYQHTHADTFHSCQEHTAARFCEFGRACVKRALTGSGRNLRYFGCMLEEFQTNSSALRNMTYKEWDGNPEKSPPKTRVRDNGGPTSQPPALEILAWSDNAPRFPDVLVARFPQGTVENQKIMEMHEKFKEHFPESSQPAPVDPQGGRVGGLCDYTVDGGKQPLDPDRDIDLCFVQASELPESRPTCLFPKPPWVNLRHACLCISLYELNANGKYSKRPKPEVYTVCA